MVPVCNRQENFKCFRYNDIPGDYLGSLVSLDSGAMGDLCKVQIGVRGSGFGVRGSGFGVRG